MPDGFSLAGMGLIFVVSGAFLGEPSDTWSTHVSSSDSDSESGRACLRVPLMEATMGNLSEDEDGLSDEEEVRTLTSTAFAYACRQIQLTPVSRSVVPD